MPEINYNASGTKTAQIAKNLSLLMILSMFLRRQKALLKCAIHYNWAGDADDLGGRWTAWLLPSIGVAAYYLSGLAASFPQFLNYPAKLTVDNAQRQYILARQSLAVINLMTLILFILLQL